MRRWSHCGTDGTCDSGCCHQLSSAVSAREPDVGSLVRSVIDEALEDEFEASIPWASGIPGSLKRPIFLNCHLHYGRFARHVLLGVYGTRLESATLMTCGTRDDNILDVPPAPTPVHGSIDSLRLNHFDPWGLSAVSIIPVRDLSLTRAHAMAFLELPTLLKGSPDTGSSHVGFRGLEWLRMSQKLSFEDTWRRLDEGARQAYEELKRSVCTAGNRTKSGRGRIYIMS